METDEDRPNHDHPGPMAPETSLRIGGNHGYRIDGDTASLNADLAILHEGVHRTGWALQLWACENPHQGGSLSGVRVAETSVVLPSSPEMPILRLEAETLANIPLSRGEYSMVLVLASGRPGAFEHVHDFANYPRRELFLVPRLEGTIGYSIEADRVVLRVDRVDNPRPRGCLSGSLVLELWALNAPYSGGALDGFVLAKAEVGQIAGQSALESLRYSVALSPPPRGQWRLALILREWTAASGFVSRDCCNFPVPFASANVEPETGAPLNTLTDETWTPESSSKDRAIWSLSHDEIAAAAYYGYLARGPGPGDALHDWLKAEEQLLDARRSIDRNQTRD
jgi:hypothetical protein